MVRTWLFLAVLLSANLAHASGGFEFKIHGYYIINFLAMVFLLYTFVRKPLSNYLTTRAEMIREQVEASRKLREEAIAKYEEAKSKLDQLEDELEAMRKHFAEEGELAKKRMIESADRAAAKLERNADLLVQQELRGVRKKVRDELVAMALAKAEAKIRGDLDDAAQTKMITLFIDSLKDREELKSAGELQ
ncbi:MAG: ATP synthase F0 subunit B [Myxococcales bacterium]|nr:ATP synthase F0 subunit B [Myxococcales bacterium]